MDTPNPQQAPNNQRRPRVGFLYLQGLAVYLGYRLLDVGASVTRLAMAPYRYTQTQLQRQRRRLKAWLARYKRRLLWSALTLLFLSLIVGSGVILYLWRAEMLAVAFRLQGFLTRLANPLHRRAEPVVVVAAEVVQDVPIPAVPGVDGLG